MQRATLVMLLLFNIKILSLNTIVYFKYIMMLHVAMYNKMISLHIHVMILPLIITNKCIMNDPTNRAFSSTEYYLKGLKKVTE